MFSCNLSCTFVPNILLFMKAVVEDLIVEKNNLVKWLNLSAALLFLSCVFIIKDDPWKNQWYGVGGFLLFGGIYLNYLKYKITTAQEGFTIHSLLKPKFILWKEISALNYIAKSSKTPELKLAITYGKELKNFELSVKQFKKKQMQRFFEMLNEQCDNALKNEFFIKQVAGDLTWKEQLNMLR